MKEAKDKAEELIEKFGIEKAILCVDEILWEIIKYADNSRQYVVKNSSYWNEVKQEILNRQ